ncbi:putative bifunctional diguanylate cyclase/phosphodiesterase [Nitratifractor sp.]
MESLAELMIGLGLNAQRPPNEKEWPEVLKMLGRKLRQRDSEYRWMKEQLESSYEEIQQLLKGYQNNSRRAMERLTEIFPDVILLIDEENHILDLFNPNRLSPYLKIDREKVIGLNIAEALPREFSERILALLRQAEKKRQPLYYSEYRVGEGSQKIPVEIKVNPAESEGHGREAFIVALRNKHSSKAFPDNISQQVFDKAREGMAVISLDGELLYTNASFDEIFGEKVDGTFQSLQFFFRPSVFGEVLRSVAQESGYSGEVLIRRPDGIQLPIWLNLETISDEQGEPLYRYAIFTNIAELQRSEVAQYHAATHDTLTGLPNREGLLEHLDLTLKRSLRHHGSGAVFFIDLDNFKEINDSMGHLVGDKVLVEIGRRVKQVIRETDIFGRLGGDEFLLIVEEISSPDTLMHIAQKVIDAINRPIPLKGMNYTVGASVGITIFPKDGHNREELLRYADMAMYRAKEQGKNRYHFYSSHIDDEVKRRFFIEKALDRALDEGGFFLVFQPQIDLATNVIVGLEALLRLQIDDETVLMPDEFIPIAEESDVILRIGRWVVTRCCQILYSWQKMYHLPFLQFSINLSRRQLIDETWVDFVEKTLRKYQINPLQIEFEITETAFMHSGEQGYQVLRDLQKLGCRLSIDDFGTGYSSLSSLKEFTVDRLKIDRSFVNEITQNNTDRAIVKASIAMAQALGLKTIAEGVETSEQKHIVKLLGCKEMQGFHYSRPLDEESALRLVLSSIEGRRKDPFFRSSNTRFLG